jgi:hypothetical protein
METLSAECSLRLRLNTYEEGLNERDQQNNI